MPSTSGEVRSSGDVESRLPESSSGAGAAGGNASAGASAAKGGSASGEALAKQATCLNCHAVDTKKVGPSFKDLSKKFKGANADKVVADMKAKPVHQGALKAAKEDDVKSIVRWIQTL